jgi:DNA-binding FadR family transcriptional regulator
MQKKLRSPALSQKIQGYIKDYIVENNLKADDSLPSEGQIAEMLEVSRSPVREAVKALQSLGIIEAKQGEGLFVREWNLDPLLETLNYGMRISPIKLRELYQIRVWLEVAVTDKVIEKITDQELIELDILMLRWEQIMKAGKAYTHLDEDFHRILLGVSGNESLVKLFEAFWVAFDNYGGEKLVSKENDRVLREHKDVLEAFKKRDSALARKMLLIHFEGFQDRVDQLL